MDGDKEKSGEKESSGETSSGSKEKLPQSRGANWNVMAVRGKVTDRCLWSACKAMTAGFFFIVIGAGMATLGFYSDHLSKIEETKGNTTVWVKNESKDSQLGSLTYLGPVVMGIGGFTIVAACVMTFEARDTAAKIVPIWFKRTRIHVVSGGSGSTLSGRSSKASWERFLSQYKSSEDNRTAVTQALVNFSKYLQNSVDANKIPLQNPTTKNQQLIGMRKCPSEPSLAKSLRGTSSNPSEAMPLFETSTPQPSQRTTYSGGLKTITGASKPQLLSVAPDTYRQAVSMDYPRSSRHEEEEEKENFHVANAVTTTTLQMPDKAKIQVLPFQTSCATSSSGSMSVDIYLPQGAVTLKVHDDMKDHKRSPLKSADSDESRCTKFSQHSGIRSFENDDEFLSTDLDDSVFIGQDTYLSTPQIVLESSDSKKLEQSCLADNRIEGRESSSVEQWAVPYPTMVPHAENKSESLEVHTPAESPISPSISPNFSFDCSEANSPGASIDSVISNPFSSRMCTHPSLSHTDTSFYNVSSLNSMGSSQDISSPAVFCGSPKSFDFNLDPSSGNQDMKSYLATVKRSDVQKKKTLSESTRKHVSITLEPESGDRGHKTSPRKHSSLESAQIQSSKAKPSESPKRHQLSLESQQLSEDSLVIPPLSPRFLSPMSPSASPTVLTFSPRKTRSESLPERRQAPSLKRFPLLRQGALDSFAEEGGSTHRLDRSLTQISPKDP